jgi:hypothetical protein
VVRRRFLVLLFATLTAACTTAPANQRPLQNLWVIQGGWLAHVLYHEPRIAKDLFLREPSIVLGAVPGRRLGITSFAFTSYRDFSESVERSPYWFQGFTSVLYDPEGWDATPPQERQHPANAIRSFAALGHREGWSVIVTPHHSLASVPGAECASEPGETEREAFLRCDITGAAATYADVVETQAQDLQTTPDEYRSFVETTAAQARAANPDVKVIAGLSASGTVTPSQLLTTWDSVRDLVDGYYLAIQDNHHASVAIAFLRLVERTVPTSTLDQNLQGTS